MVLFYKCDAAALLVIFTQSIIVSATLRSDLGRSRIVDKNIVHHLQVPWIYGIDSYTRSTQSSCADDLATVSAGFESRQNWTMDMLDASSKIQSGIRQGNIRDLGMYDQCVQVNAEYNGTTIQGQHCLISFTLLSSSVCVPSSCNETEVRDLVNAALENVPDIDGFELGSVNGVSCARVGDEDFTAGEILTIVFFSLVGAFMIACTICDFAIKWRSRGDATVLNEFAKFSLYTNGKALLSTDVNPKMMPAIQGIRFLSMCWVVVGHRFLLTTIRPIVNLVEVNNWYNSWTSLWIQAAPFAVDTFFVISGFLMSYLYLKSKKSGKRSNFHMMYIHRYLRLTPALAILVLFVAVLLHRITNGPIWQTVQTLYVEPCRKNWWLNMLYVQNLVRPEEMCLLHSWYLAVDMQLFWISPFILYPLHRWPKYGLGFLGLLIVASVVTPPVLLGVEEYSNAVMRLDVSMADALRDFHYFYIPTYNRACAYFVGILMGYDAAQKKRHFSKMNVAINWVVTFIFLAICGWATTLVYVPSTEYNLVAEIIFAIILRPMWSIAIAWMVYACCYGYGGPLTSFFSLPIFMPLSRLSYCIYLVHMVIQTVNVSAAHIPDRFTDFRILSYFWNDLVISFVIAFFFSLFFESPVVVLEKILRAPRSKRERKEPPKVFKKDIDAGFYNKGMSEV